MKARARLCWWCSSKLSAVSHAEIKDHDGRTVLVHKICERDALAYIKPVTAACPSAPEVSLLTRGGWSRKDAAAELTRALADAAVEDGM